MRAVMTCNRNECHAYEVEVHDDETRPPCPYVGPRSHKPCPGRLRGPWHEGHHLHDVWKSLPTVYGRNEP